MATAPTKALRFWELAKENHTRTALAAALGVKPTNVDASADFAGLRKQLPTVGGFTTAAADNFSFNMRRYDTLVKAAPPALPAGSKRGSGGPLEREQHMYQAAIVLGVGAFDAYIREFTIGAYLHLFFSSPPRAVTMPKKTKQTWNEAVQAAVSADPSLLIRVASLAPAQAQLELAAHVFDVQSVRLMTGEFKAANDRLSSTGVTLDVRSGPAFLRLAPAIFDAYAAARHVFIHVGTSPGRSRSTSGRPPHAYCANDEPARFLGDFLRSLVSVVEQRWKSQVSPTPAATATSASSGSP